MTNDKTCRDYLTAVMSSNMSRKWINEELKERIKAIYHVNFQNNTIAKNLSFMIEEGEAQSEMAPGKNCAQYWLVNRTVRVGNDPIKLMEECLKIAATYPEDHPQRAAIMEQYARLTERKAA